MSTRTRIASLLTALVVLVPLAVPALAVATDDADRGSPALCERMPELPRCQQSRPPEDPCDSRPELPRCQQVDCEQTPDDPKCQEPVDRCEVRPEHPRCQDRVDRCGAETDNHPRCPSKPNYRQLFWRIVNAGDWKMLIRLLVHLGLL